ncbi:MAG: type II secretion system protein GspN, partial [Myxococcota bacterium]
SLSLDVRARQGRLSGRVSPGKDDFEFELEAEQLDLASPPVLGQLLDLPVRGVFDGEVAMRLPHDAAKSNGDAKISIAEARFGPGSVSGFSVPGLGLGKLDFVFELRDGRLRLASFAQQGGDLALKLTASTTLRPELTRAALDACAQVKANDALLNAQPTLRAALQLAEVRLRKDPQGFLHVPLSGTLAAPRLRGGLCRPTTGR